MTNEQLAEQAAGSRGSYAALLLWERTEPLMNRMCSTEYQRRKAWFDRCGVTLQDLKQTAYLDVFIPALKAYSPERDIKFTTYLSYPFMHAVSRLLGMHNGIENRKPLDNCVSLDAPLCEDMGDGEPLTLGETLADDEPSPEEVLTDTDMKKIIRLAVYALDEPYHTVISRHYLADQPIALIAEEMGEDENQVRAICRKGLRTLRNDESLLLLMDFKDLDRMERCFRIYSWGHGFDSSPEYAAAAELAGTFRAYDYGKRQAVMYEAMDKYRQRTTTN